MRKPLGSSMSEIRRYFWLGSALKKDVKDELSPVRREEPPGTKKKTCFHTSRKALGAISEDWQDSVVSTVQKEVLGSESENSIIYCCVCLQVAENLNMMV